MTEILTRSAELRSEVTGNTLTGYGQVWGTYADHRMATAGAIIGLRVPGVHVEDIATTAKTLAGNLSSGVKALADFGRAALVGAVNTVRQTAAFIAQ